MCDFQENFFFLMGGFVQDRRTKHHNWFNNFDIAHPFAIPQNAGGHLGRAVAFLTIKIAIG
jgi:hypothetical protein